MDSDGANRPVAGDAATTNSPATLVAEVFCDGACIGNPGPGGYGTIVRLPGRPVLRDSGGLARTTNNQMELTAAIVGLTLAVEAGAKVVRVVSDSEYLVKGMNGWVTNWKRKGWKTTGGTPVKNQEMWEALDALTTGVTVAWHWIPGHAGHRENEECDQLATAAARRAAQRRVAGPKRPGPRYASARGRG
jgi:ribonuclease HI